MKGLTALTGLFLSLVCTAQIELAPAQVSAPRQLVAGVERVDSLDRQYAETSDIGTLLNALGWNVLRLGASGQAATLRQNGYSADHTTLWWNGFNLNSLTLGSADLSGLPAFLFDHVELNLQPWAGYAAGSSFAGNVSLQNTPATQSEVHLLSGFNSLENRWAGTGVSLHRETQHGAVDHRIKVVWQSDENKFEYRDPYRLEDTTLVQSHNDHRMAHVLWQSSVSGRAGALQVGIWGSTREVEIPAILGAYGASFATQEESSLRSFIGWKSERSSGRWEAKAGAEWSSFVYSDQGCAGCPQLTLSDLPTERQFLELKWTHPPKEREHRPWQWFSRLERNHTGAAVLGGDRTQWRWQWGGRWTSRNGRWAASGRWQALDGVWPAFSVNRLFRSERFFGRLQFSRRFRLPDFNELYWVPGGNNALRPEQGWALDASGEVALGTHLAVRGSAGLNALEDWIQWLPEGAVWTPVNTQSARQMYAEGSVEWNKASWNLKAKARWQSTHFSRSPSMTMGQLWSTVASALEPAIYTPTWTANARAVWRWAPNWSIWMRGEWLSERFTESNRTLEPVLLFHAGLAWNRGKFRLAINAENFTNHTYRLNDAFPLPGRVWQGKIAWRIPFKTSPNSTP